ncbi:MAG: hypothetical protein IJ806_12085 [Ruminococcus sp.]|nr:hypothetical protein [Ruminococcus sp.]
MSLISLTKLKKIGALMTAALMSVTFMGMETAAAESVTVPTLNLALTANRTSFNAGNTVTYTVYYGCENGNAYSAELYLDIPEGLDFVSGSFAFTASNVKKLGFESSSFTEEAGDGTLPYKVVLSGGSGVSQSGRTKIATFKCKVSSGAKGIYSVGTVGNRCVYNNGEGFAKGGWMTSAASISVGVDSPDDPLIPSVPPTPPDVDDGYIGTVTYANSDLSVQTQSAINALVGENSVTVSSPSGKKMEGAGLLVIDLRDCADEIGKVTVTGIYADGKKISFNNSRVVYGADGAELGENDYRIELYSTFGTTAGSKPFDPAKISFESELTINFTVAEYKELVSVKGSVKKSDLKAGCEISFTENSTGKVYKGVFSGDSFTADVERGTYTVEIKRGDYLTVVMKDVAVISPEPEQLREVYMGSVGDINFDGQIDYLDLSMLISMINQEIKVTPYQDFTASVDGDEEYNMLDVSLFISMINKEGHFVSK